MNTPGESFAGRVRALAGAFGELGEVDQYRQERIDLRVAVARAHRRVLGGEVAAGDAAVHVFLPFCTGVTRHPGQGISHQRAGTTAFFGGVA